MFFSFFSEQNGNISYFMKSNQNSTAANNCQLNSYWCTWSFLFVDVKKKMSNCEFSIFDVADLTSCLIGCCCGEKVVVTEENVSCRGQIYLVRVFIYLTITTAEFATEVFTFGNDTNRTFLDVQSYKDGIISPHLFYCYVVTIVELVLILLVMCFCCWKFSKVCKTCYRYWIMIYVFKILMLMLDVTLLMFSILLTLWYGGDFLEISSLSKAFVSVIFLIKCVDVIVDILFIFKGFLACVGCYG